MTLLQHIIFPDDRICDTSSMYYRTENGTISFNTYFNCFSLTKWRHYTELKNLELVLYLKGSWKVNIYGDEQLLLTKTFLQVDESQQKKVNIPLDANSKIIWFSITGIDVERNSNREEAKAQGLDSCESHNLNRCFIKAFYATEDDPVNKVKIAIDICTYKREKEVLQNIRSISENILDETNYSEAKNFEVFLIDNGNTLHHDDMNFSKTSRQQIHLFPNINAGGSGGFTRGILEVLEANKRKAGFTHTLLMDDDVMFLPETFIRTFALLQYQKAEYQNACIGGAMLRLDRRYVQHEAGAIWNGVTSVRTKEGLDLRDFAAVCNNEQEADRDYAGWWFACYPMTVIKEDNLPLPFFLHCDDIEYGLRNKNKLIYLNGICVWHNTFEHRRTSSISYHDIRNIMAMNAMIYPDGNQTAWLRSMNRRIAGDILRYRYKDAKIKCEAIEDFLNGPDYIFALDPAKKLKKLNEEGYKPIAIKELTDDSHVLEEIFDGRGVKEEKPKKVPIYKIITLNGWLLPSKTSSLRVHPMGCDPFDLYREKNVLLFDPYNHTGFIVSKEYRSCLKIIRLYLGEKRKLKKSYPKLLEQYREAKNAYSTLKSWKKYLQLE